MIAGVLALGIFVLIYWVFKPLCENVPGGGFIVSIIVLVGSCIAGVGLNKLTDILYNHDIKNADINKICKIPNIMYSKPGSYIYIYQIIPTAIQRKYCIHFNVEDSNVAERLYTLNTWKIKVKAVGETDIVFYESYNKTSKVMRLVVV